MIPDSSKFTQDFDFGIDSKGVYYSETCRSFVNPKLHDGKAYLDDLIDSCTHETIHYCLDGNDDITLDEKHEEWIIEILAKIDEFL